MLNRTALDCYNLTLSMHNTQWLQCNALSEAPVTSCQQVVQLIGSYKKIVGLPFHDSKGVAVGVDVSSVDDRSNLPPSKILCYSCPTLQVPSFLVPVRDLSSLLSTISISKVTFAA